MEANDMNRYVFTCPAVFPRVSSDLSKDFILPDSYPDIKKVLSAKPFIRESESYADFGKAKYSGEVENKVLFVNDEGKLGCASFVQEYEGVYPYDQSGNETAFSFPYLENPSAREVNPRKINLKCRLCPDLFVFDRSDFEVEYPDSFKDEDIASLERNTEKINGALFSEFSSGSFDSGDDVIINGLPIERIFYTDVQIKDLEATLSEGTISVSGEAEANIGYTVLDGSKEEEVFIKHKVPFTETFDAPGVTDKSEALCRGYITKASAVESEDASGEKKIIELDFSYVIKALVSSLSEALAVRDVYSDSYDIIPEFEEKYYPANPKRFSVKKTVTLPVKEGEEIGNVIYAFGNVFEDPDKNYKDSSVTGKAEVTLLCKDENGRYSVMKNESPFEIETDFPFDGYMGNITLCDIRTEKKEDGLHSECTIALDGIFFDLKKEKALVSFKAEMRNESENRSSFTVYYPSENETLWDIAKKYRVSKYDLMEMNGIESESEKPKRVLLIPGERKAVFKEII